MRRSPRLNTALLFARSFPGKRARDNDQPITTCVYGPFTENLILHVSQFFCNHLDRERVSLTLCKNGTVSRIKIKIILLKSAKNMLSANTKK